MKHMPVDDTLLTDDSRLLTDAELDLLTGTSRTTRWRLRRQGKWPPRVEIGGISGNTLGQIRELMRKGLEEAEARAATIHVEPATRGRPKRSAA
ncbi:hypothetical protein GOB36_15325 [Sinorhizobium meliloti]|uniref:helix-turn-helix transcriptional regulator n=1 Tax=Rhizobium meliloti TaxID=382 RepID=UPI00299F2A88|nr:hypothetical protein [Sinorhizobium meliloti]MDX0033049.1 hypothetical protein [Sinorhizobium meliloti]